MIGLFCPGQGSQFVGMGKDLAEAFPLARATFEEADEALGIPLSRLCWEGTEEELRRTMNAQPGILVHSIAVWRVIADQKPVSVSIAAGHSLGEFSAYVAAQSISFADAVRLVRRRGELMFEAGRRREGAMAALLGIDDSTAEAVCERAAAETSAVVVPANYNSPGQVVISGDAHAVRRASEIVRDEVGRKAVPLNVSGAFHSPLMESAVPGLCAGLDAVRLQDAGFPVVSNVTGEPNSSAQNIRDLLVRQLTGSVRWAQSVRGMIASGATEFIEVGPSNVLSGLLRRIDRTATARALGSAAEVQAYIGEG